MSERMLEMIVSNNKLGAEWPFKCKAVKVRFHGESITVQDGEGPEYALNGIAHNMGYRLLDDIIWKDDPETGKKVSPGLLINLIHDVDAMTSF